jgi:hypothetical protein
MAKADKELIMDPELAAESKAIAVSAFRNGPLEDVHPGKECPTCSGKIEYSHITQDETKRIMKNAANKVIRFFGPEPIVLTSTHPSPVSERGSLQIGPPKHSRHKIEKLARIADLLSGVQKGPDDSSSVQHKSKWRREARKKQSS